jgi:hypothetical protein
MREFVLFFHPFLRSGGVGVFQTPIWVGDLVTVVIIDLVPLGRDWIVHGNNGSGKEQDKLVQFSKPFVTILANLMIETPARIFIFEWKRVHC